MVVAQIVHVVIIHAIITMSPITAVAVIVGTKLLILFNIRNQM